MCNRGIVYLKGARYSSHTHQPLAVRYLYLIVAVSIVHILIINILDAISDSNAVLMMFRET